MNFMETELLINKTENKITTPLHPKEYNLISYIRKLGWGEIDKIIIQNGLPTLIKTTYKTIKL